MTPDKVNGQPLAARHLHPAGIILVLLALVVAGCAGAPAQSVSGTPAVTLALVAQNSKFDLASLDVPAGSPFAIAFDNRDSVPHNVSIRGGSSPLTTPVITEIFGGPATRTYLYPSLAAGSYTFICDVHPAEMTGTVTAN